MKIHFACLFGVDYDMDLLPWWGRFYLDAHFDSYHIFLHRENGYIEPETIQKFKETGFTVSTVGGIFERLTVDPIGGPQANGVLRSLTLGKYASSLPGNDYLVTADADEFQFMPTPDTDRFQFMPSPDAQSEIKMPPANIQIPYRDLLEHYDILAGWMIDRWSDVLEECTMDPLIQYPEEELFTRDIIKSVSPPFLRRTEWLKTRRNKILAAHCGDNVAYMGSHCMETVSSQAEILDDFRVLHFAWREGSKQKVAVKSYYSRENLDEIFGGKAPEEYVDKMSRCMPTIS